MSVVPLFRCRCGSQGKLVVVEFSNEKIEQPVCQDCVDGIETLLNQVRPVYKKMLECKVPEHIADKTMMFLLDRMDND